jgi:exodeoxyribonuclease VIII
MDVMVDLETLGTDNDCVVVSLGACTMDLETKKIESTFYMIFEIQDQLDKGRVIQADTLKWWFKQENAAQKVFHDEAKAPIMILNTFSQWLKRVCPDSKKLKVWGNGATFDISIMEHMFNMYNVKRPWVYSGVQDLRTFRRFQANNEKIPNDGTKHVALDDAIAQAQFVFKHYKPQVTPQSDPQST